MENKSLIVQIEELKHGLMHQINSSKLPIPISKYVLDEIKGMVDLEYSRLRDSEMYKYQKSLEEVDESESQE